MAPHGGNDKRFEFQVLEGADGRFNNGAVVGNSPTAAGHRNRLTWFDSLFNFQPVYLGRNFPGNVVEDPSLEALSDPNHFGKVHVCHLPPREVPLSRKLLLSSG